MVIGQDLFRELHSRASANPDSETSEGSFPVVNVVILKLWTKCELVGIEVQPSVQNGHRICMLDQRTSHQSSHDVILGRYQTTPIRGIRIDGCVDSRLQCIDIEYSILLACSNIHPTPIVGRKAGLLRAALPWVLYCR